MGTQRGTRTLAGHASRLTGRQKIPGGAEIYSSLFVNVNERLRQPFWQMRASDYDASMQRFGRPARVRVKDADEDSLASIAFDAATLSATEDAPLGYTVQRPPRRIHGRPRKVFRELTCL